MAISYKTKQYNILSLQMASLYNITVALNLEQLYNKTSDSALIMKRAVKFPNFDKCTLYNASKYIAKMKTVKCAAFLKSIICKNARA